MYKIIDKRIILKNCCDFIGTQLSQINVLIPSVNFKYSFITINIRPTKNMFELDMRNMFSFVIGGTESKSEIKITNTVY